VGIIDLILTMFMFVETAFRVAIDRRSFLKNGANTMDTIVCLLNLTELIICGATHTSLTNNSNSINQLLRGSKFVRIMRLYFQNNFFKY
jgi:hypothetical protein